jgi:hypothetical protein
MGAEINLLVLLALGLLIGAVLGWISFFRLGQLCNELTGLQDELARLRRQTIRRRLPPRGRPHRPRPRARTGWSP